MRDKLKEYVSLLFAGAQGSEEIREEILQNTLDRYDDLISQGKSPEAAYRLAITGIGDLSEILEGISHKSANYAANSGASPVFSSVTPAKKEDTPLKMIGRAIAIGLYILSPLPLFVLSELGMDTIGFCGTLAIVATATVLILLCRKVDSYKSQENASKSQNELSKGVEGLVWAIGLAAYLILSFATGAWYITWVIFPITGAVNGLIKAILDLKEK